MTVAETQHAPEVPPSEGEAIVDPPRVVLSAAQARGALLARLFELLDRNALPYCVLHGYENFGQHVESDVDLLMPPEVLPGKLAALLRANEESLGAAVVQWFRDSAHFIVLCAPSTDPATPPMMLQLHVSTDYVLHNRLIYRGDEILRTRKRHANGFWVPAGQVEFACMLANRVLKRNIQERHEQTLSELWRTHRDLCGEELFRLFSHDNTRRIADAAEAGNFIRVHPVLPQLRRELLRNTLIHQPVDYSKRLASKQGRRLLRWLRPRSGLHVVFLGPDGVGKSTVIDAVKERIAPAFLHVKYRTFARSLLPNKPKAAPHALPPRSKTASLLKAAWWAVCYTLGYFVSVHPTRARSGLAINHRYLLDAIVDPMRYRYAGPPWLLRFIWAISPKPDLIVILDAPPEVIQQRKQEIPPEETARQCRAYRALAASVRNSWLIDASQTPQKTIEQVTTLILAHLSERIVHRFRNAR